MLYTWKKKNVYNIYNYSWYNPAQLVRQIGCFALSNTVVLDYVKSNHICYIHVYKQSLEQLLEFVGVREKEYRQLIYIMILKANRLFCPFWCNVTAISTHCNTLQHTATHCNSTSAATHHNTSSALFDVM